AGWLNAAGEPMAALPAWFPPEAPDERLRARLHEARRYKIIDAIVNIDMQDPAATLVPAAQNPADDKDGMRDFSPETVHHRRRDGFKFAHDILRPAFENRWRAADAQPVTTPAGSWSMSARMQRAVYAEMFGPTTGDRVRLADTDIIIEVEKDFCTYGEEVKFGGGKVIRDGMGQSQIANKAGAVDTVITNALILDHWGIVKADGSWKAGRIPAIGRAGSPAIQPNPTIVIGPGTEVIAGEAKILTAGGFDTHIHYICPQQVEEALMSGVTSMLGGGTGPAHGTF